MAEKPKQQFGTRKPVVAPPASPPAKRSGHVALLVMGTIAVGSTAYMLMPHDNASRIQPGMTTPTVAPSAGTRFFVLQRHAVRADRRAITAAVPPASSGTTDSSSVKRGGFGSSAQAFSSHFSFGS